jgi:hypothetical protein
MSSSRARTVPRSSATAPPSAAAGEGGHAGRACHTVAAPRAGYTSVLCVLVDRLTDTSGQLNMPRAAPRAGTVRMRWTPMHRIRRRTRIHRKNRQARA